MTKQDFAIGTDGKVIIEISNVGPLQIKKFVDLFASMQVMGSIGTSRGVKLFVDGDGSFRPKFLINGSPITFATIGGEGEYKDCISPHYYENVGISFD